MTAPPTLPAYHGAVAHGGGGPLLVLLAARPVAQELGPPLLVIREGGRAYPDGAGNEAAGPSRRARQPVLPEKLLAKLWLARAGRRMRTTDGRQLRVVYPGRPAPGHGPDFRDAVIELEGRRLRGPVELHRTPGDWNAHGHSRDPAYDGVILHVVGDAGEARGGPTVPTVEMGAEETGQSARRERQSQQGCGAAVRKDGTPLARLAALEDDPLLAALRRAGMARFRERAHRAAEAVTAHGVEQALYLGLMEALGYSENRAPFRELARRLPVALLRAAALAFPPERRGRLLRDLLGPASGLEPPSEVWLRLGGAPPMDRRAWRLAGVRPANHPLRRMDAAAVLLAWTLPPGLCRSLQAACMEGSTGLIGALRCSGGPGQPRQAEAAAGGDGRPGTEVLGEQRAREIAVNEVLPVLLANAQAKQDRSLARACVKCYESFPALADNTVTREARRLLGQRGVRLRLGACEHQGLMHLYRKAVNGKR